MFGFKTSMEESFDFSEYEKFNINELEVESKISGVPHLIRFDPEEGKKYATARLQIINHDEKQIATCYCNLPLNYPVIKKIFRANDFYKNTFNLIENVMGLIDIDNVLDTNGKPINCIEEINLEEFIKYVNELKKMNIEIIENGDYNSFKVEYIEQ